MIKPIRVHDKLEPFARLVALHSSEIEDKMNTNSLLQLDHAISNEQLFELFHISNRAEMIELNFIAPLDGVQRSEIGNPVRILSEAFVADFVLSLRKRQLDSVAASFEKRCEFPCIDIQHSTSVLSVNLDTGKNDRNAEGSIKRDNYFLDYSWAVSNRFLIKPRPTFYTIEWDKLKEALSNLDHNTQRRL